MSREVPLRRAIILPPDLFHDCGRLARADHFASIQAWVVVKLQEVVNARQATRDVQTQQSA